MKAVRMPSPADTITVGEQKRLDWLDEDAWTD